MGGQWLLDKVRGLNDHGGGQQVIAGSGNYAILVDYLELLTGDTFGGGGVGAAAYSIELPAKTYRRASLLLTGNIPRFNLGVEQEFDLFGA